MNGSAPASGHLADHGIGLSLERPHPIQPVQIGMTDEQPGLQRIQIGAIGSRGGNRLVAVTGRSTIASETVALTFDTSETAVTALRAV